MRPPIERDNAHVVNHLDLNRHGSGRLNNLVVVIVEARQHRSRHSARDTAIIRATIEPRVRRMQSPTLVLFVSSLGCSRRQGGYSAVRWIDDERSTVG